VRCKTRWRSDVECFLWLWLPCMCVFGSGWIRRGLRAPILSSSSSCIARLACSGLRAAAGPLICGSHCCLLFVGGGMLFVQYLFMVGVLLFAVCAISPHILFVLFVSLYMINRS
jgi:hypothetical protein